MELGKLIKDMCSIPSVSGHEKYYSERLYSLIGEMFDEHYVDAVGNQVYIRRCGKENPTKLLIDTHFDEIGLSVTKIHDGGFLSVSGVGGVDTRILEASRVIVYGKQTFKAVMAYKPTHIRPEEDSEKLVPMEQHLIDTGYSREWLEENVRLGTPVGFDPIYTDLKNDRIAGKAFDDKSCGACAVFGIASVEREKLAGDIYCVFTVQEETGMLGGRTVAYNIAPDAALIMDVCHATAPDANCIMGLEDGVMVSHSALTSRSLTGALIEECKNAEIKFAECAEATGTGTNANRMGYTRDGIPTVLVSLPIKSMHSANESLSLLDADELVKVVKTFITSEKISEVCRDD